MRFIYKAIGTAVASYVVKKVIDALQRDERWAKPIKDVKVAANNMANKVGVISDTTKAEWNKEAVEAYKTTKQPVNANPAAAVETTNDVKHKQVNTNKSLEAQTV